MCSKDNPSQPPYIKHYNALIKAFIAGYKCQSHGALTQVEIERAAKEYANNQKPLDITQM